MKNYKERYKRKNFISLCLSDEELSYIEDIISNINESRAAAIRTILLSNASEINQKIKRNDNSELRFELNKIGNNINQIAKKINTNPDLFIFENGESFVIEITRLNEKLQNIFERLI